MRGCFEVLGNGIIDKESGLNYLLQLAQVMKKLGYCLNEIKLHWECCGYAEWTPSVEERKFSLFYLTRLLREISLEGVREGKLLPFALAGMGDSSYVNLYEGVEIDKAARENYYQNYVTGISGIDTPQNLPSGWKSYIKWVTDNCHPYFLAPSSVTDSSDKLDYYYMALRGAYGEPDLLLVPEIVAVITGNFVVYNESYVDDLKEKFSSILLKNGFTGMEWGIHDYNCSKSNIVEVKSGSNVFNILSFKAIDNSWCALKNISSFLDLSSQMDLVQGSQSIRDLLEVISKLEKEIGPTEVTGSVMLRHSVPVIKYEIKLMNEADHLRPFP